MTARAHANVRTCLAGGILTAALFAGGETAAQMPAQPLLTIEGTSGPSSLTKTISLTREQIAALPQRTITTSTPWTQGKSEFKGVALRDLLDHASILGDRLKVVAINNYASDMKLSDVAQHAVVAHEMNGKPMPVREKGPLWIVFPFDDHPELKSEQFYARSVWQVRKIVVLSE